MERAIRKHENLESDKRVAIDLLRALENDTMGTFVGLLGYEVGDRWAKRLDNEVGSSL